MIVDFSVGNFKSFQEIQTTSLLAANIVSKNKLLDEHNLISVSDNLKLLKSKAIYGANASGKSNFIGALFVFISIVNDSFRDEKILSHLIDPFLLSTESKEMPTFFQMNFIIEKAIYRYGFEATQDNVISEWLFVSEEGKRETKLFIREGVDVNLNKKSFKEGARASNGILREDALFLTTIKALNGKISKMIIDFLSDIMIVSGLGDRRMQKAASDALKNDVMRKQISKLLKLADTGINDVELFEITQDSLPEDAPDEVVESFKDGRKLATVITEHNVFNEHFEQVDSHPFSLRSNESEGTIKMFEIGFFILKAIEEKRILLIDEFDARFHPSLTKKLVEFMNSPANTGAQIVFTTHDTNLLSNNLLRRDQISFIEKDKYGRSKAYSLVDFKGIRNDATLEKDYTSGKFGAIPYLGNFETLIN